MSLASDLNNQEFVGARNPDSGLYVEFYWSEPIDGWASAEKSREQQRRVEVKLPKQAFIRIMVPGDKTTIFETAVQEAHKQRFPRQWLAWQISEGLIGGEEDIPGWKISEWDECNTEMARELLYMRFQTVDQLAGASDRQIQGLGIGGLSLREKARVALRNRMGQETREIIEKERAEKEELKARIAKMEDVIAKLLGGVVPVEAPTEPANIEEPIKRGPGRPPKSESQQS